jgi:hypothetical protein
MQDLTPCLTPRFLFVRPDQARGVGAEPFRRSLERPPSQPPSVGSEDDEPHLCVADDPKGGADRPRVVEDELGDPYSEPSRVARDLVDVVPRDPLAERACRGDRRASHRDRYGVTDVELRAGLDRRLDGEVDRDPVEGHVHGEEHDRFDVLRDPDAGRSVYPVERGSSHGSEDSS